ncbi:uncharacterized protein LOC143265000 [Megachile rotundata]|uniref:uncharacterized protein LOC143265000 n=1 Tax=Megachile rotundata TaxID=143995 RepID=UPI003FD0088D
MTHILLNAHASAFIAECPAMSGILDLAEEYQSMPLVIYTDSLACLLESSQLDAKTAEEIEDILLNPSPEWKYEKLRTELISRLSTSKKRRIQRLLEHEEMGDRTPSQFLRHLRTLAGSDVPEELLKMLWASRLPTTIQSVLAAQDGMEMEKLAALADKIGEITPHSRAPSLAVASISDVDQLVKQIAAMVTAELQKQDSRGHSRSRSGDRSYRPRSKARLDRRNGLCYFH